MRYICKHCKNEVTHIIDIGKQTEIFICFHCGRKFERAYKPKERVYEVDFDNKTIRLKTAKFPKGFEVI